MTTQNKIGFTGTQRGMTAEQMLSFRDLILSYAPKEFHHGDCVGADKHAHEIVRRELPNTRILGHPPELDLKRAFCQCHELFPQRPYLVRNTNIVTYTDMLIATPGEDGEIVRSGTWSTVRRARAARKPIVIIRLDGFRVID